MQRRLLQRGYCQGYRGRKVGATCGPSNEPTQWLSLLPVPQRSCLSDAFETQRPLAYHCDAYVSVARVKCTGAEVVVKAYVRDQLSAGARQQVHYLFDCCEEAAAFSRHVA